VIKQARDISLSRGFNYDLGCAIAGFRNADLETIGAGAVLRD
jgi:hypothetical protein